MTNFLYFAENLVTTGGNKAAAPVNGADTGAGGDTAMMVRADSYLGAEPVSATQTRLFFADPIRFEQIPSRIAVTLTHANAANGGGFKNVVRAVGAAINRSNPGNSGFVVFADEENDNATIAGAEIKTGGVEYDPNFAACSPDSSTLTAGLGAVAIGKSRPASQVLSGAGVTSTDEGLPRISIRNTGGGQIHTRIKLSVEGLKGSGTANDAVGVGTVPAYLLQWHNEINGVCVSAKMKCIEVPTGGGTPDINLGRDSAGTHDEDEGVGTDVVINSGTWTKGLSIENLNPAIADNEYLYLTDGAGGLDDSVFEAGYYVIDLLGELEKENEQ